MSDQTETTETIETKKRICPCCGQSTLNQITDLDQATVDSYLACLMSGTPFSRTYPLFSGRILVTISGISDTYTPKLLRVSNYLDKYLQDLSSASTYKILLYKLLAIHSVTVTMQNKGNTITVQDNIMNAIDQLLNCVSPEKSQSQNKQSVSKFIQTIVDPSVVSSLPAKYIDSILAAHNDILESLLKLGMDQSFSAGIRFD